MWKKPLEKPTMALGPALDQESYEWLLSHHSDIAERLETDVKNGYAPRDIYQFVLRQTGRPEIAIRCRAAARHLERVGDEQEA